MRSFIAFFLLTICSAMTLGSSYEWRKAESASLAWLHSVHFTDERNGWIAGSNGTLLATKDGGDTWKKWSISSKDNLRDVHFIDASKGWLLCERTPPFDKALSRTYFLRTVDGGENWEPVEVKDLRERLVRSFFTADGKGYAIGEGGIILKLANDGDTASTSSLPVRFLMMDGRGFSQNSLILVGGGSSVLISDDGGHDWNEYRTEKEESARRLNAVSTDAKGNLWIAGNEGRIYSSSDRGRRWQKRQIPVDADLLDIVFADERTGFAVGDQGTLLVSNDAGSSWNKVNIGVRHRLEKVIFTGKRAIAVGFGGTILIADAEDKK